MPKIVYFIRHAKSSWSLGGTKDHDRPLNPRGLRDAPRMAQELTAKEQKIGQVISSTALRAVETAAFFESEYGLDSSSVILEPKLYHGDLEDYMEGVTTWADDRHEAVALFAHNPGMTYLANAFSDRFLDNVPTCGVLKVVFDVDSFAEITVHNGRLETFYYPKMFI